MFSHYQTFSTEWNSHLYIFDLYELLLLGLFHISFSLLKDKKNKQAYV